MTDSVQLSLILQADGAVPAVELDAMVRAAMNELGALPSISVDRAEGPPVPKGAKAVDSVTLEILIALSSSAVSALAPSIFQLVRNWLGMQPKGTKMLISHNGKSFELKGDAPLDSQHVAVFVQHIISS